MDAESGTVLISRAQIMPGFSTDLKLNCAWAITEAALLGADLGDGYMPISCPVSG